MLWSFPLKVQKYESATDTWGYEIFQTKEDFTAFVQSCFKLPGKYDLKNTKKWQETGLAYSNTVSRPNFEGGRYHNFIKGTVQHKRWMATQKERILNGVIYDGEYVPPFYYWYLNFCPIYNDVVKKKMLGYIWDSDLWFFQYIMLCMLLGKHAAVVKARQRGYSFKIMALLTWSYWWFEGSINTIGGYKEEFVLKSWRFLEFYRQHLNNNTTWKRGPVVAKSLEWMERKYTKEGTYIGLDSKLSGTTFKVDPENGVGGSQTIFFYEESGIAPTLLKTVGFVRPALEKGNRTTGLIVCSGAVGELDDCQDLKDIFYDPKSHNFLAVPNVWDDDPESLECGLFVSEAYNLEGFTDKEGNSLVDEALAFINKNKQDVKGKKRVDLVQLDISQKPTSPKEAFAQRKTHEFKVEELKKQQERIKLKDKENLWLHKPIKCLLDQDDNGKIIYKTNNLPEEHRYPIVPTWIDKRGVVTIYEMPEANPEWLTYFAGVDTVEVDITTTSNSIMTVDIYKRACQVRYKDEKGRIKTRFEGGKIVATYRGRFNSVEEGNQQAWYLIKLFNAFAYVERSKPNFINYMKRHGRAEKYLAKESDVPIFKDMNMNASLSSSNYGFHFPKKDSDDKKKDDNQVWKVFKSMTKEYMAREFDRKEKEDGEVIKIYTGIDRWDDYWALEEYIQYNGKKNTDRIISSSAAITIGTVYENNLGIKTINEVKEEKPTVQEYRQPRQFSMIGGGMGRDTSYTGTRNKKPKSLL